MSENCFFYKIKIIRDIKNEPRTQSLGDERGVTDKNISIDTD